MSLDGELLYIFFLSSYLLSFVTAVAMLMQPRKQMGWYILSMILLLFLAPRQISHRTTSSLSHYLPEVVIQCVIPFHLF